MYLKESYFLINNLKNLKILDFMKINIPRNNYSCITIKYKGIIIMP